MLTKQFHDEAVLTKAASRIDRFVLHDPEQGCEDRSTITTLVVRLMLNGWVTDKEKIFLDGQAPAECLTFLTRGHEYIHPEDLELFPFDVIEATSLHGGEAIFSHHYQPERMKDSYRPYRIFSAAINPDESEKIILGFFGPSHRLGTIDEDCGFARLVYLCRDVYSTVCSDITQLRHYLERSQATLLVNRSTGRTVALNQPASRAFERPDRAIVDISLDQLKYHIKPLLPSYNLKMENLSVADLAMSVVTLEPGCSGVDERTELITGLTEHLAAGTARIGLLSDRLKDLAGGEKVSRQLADVIQQQADQLRLGTRQLAFVQNNGKLPLCPQNVQTELRNAVNQVSTYLEKGCRMVEEPQTRDLTITAREGSLDLLFESILDNHCRRSSRLSNTTVTLGSSSPSGLRVLFETSPADDRTGDTLSIHSDRFVGYLAGLLGIKSIITFSIENNKLLTELIIKP